MTFNQRLNHILQNLLTEGMDDDDAYYKSGEAAFHNENNDYEWDQESEKDLPNSQDYYRLFVVSHDLDHYFDNEIDLLKAMQSLRTRMNSKNTEECYGSISSYSNMADQKNDSDPNWQRGIWTGYWTFQTNPNNTIDIYCQHDWDSLTKEANLSFAIDLSSPVCQYLGCEIGKTKTIPLNKNLNPADINWKRPRTIQIHGKTSK